ncbi:hypothetical protein KCU92_g384, partial [Aureobasidium melanogenum]
LVETVVTLLVLRGGWGVSFTSWWFYFLFLVLDVLSRHDLQKIKRQPPRIKKVRDEEGAVQAARRRPKTKAQTRNVIQPHMPNG